MCAWVHGGVEGIGKAVFEEDGEVGVGDPFLNSDDGGLDSFADETPVGGFGAGVRQQRAGCFGLKL